ncbi:class I SAM-dependent methyltransferase [Sulfuritalea sp.]|uniref:class I SAM-dependent methyltransferase n=1 Tax=Sulfuritalea sp. TaxID=2480090 RepID=UPI00286E7CE5|nr:class I SAM-dependent methyltransferase [Sulfuritalea sp.]
MDTSNPRSTATGARAFFDGLAGGWADRYKNDPSMTARLARFSDVLAGRVTPGASVLDFGCGAGVIARWLAARGYAMSGCDLSLEMIEAARRDEAASAIGWDTCGDGPLPYADEKFAAIVSSSVLEYVVDLDSTLAELHRILAPGGWLLVTIPDSRHPHRRREALKRLLLSLPLVGAWLERGRWAEGAAYLRLSRNRFSPSVWVRIIAEHGFHVEPVSPCEGPLLLLTARRGDAG